MVCDICGAPIESGDEYYEFPDGSIVCTFDQCCVQEYAERFSRWAAYNCGPDPDEQLEYHRDMKSEGRI